MMDRFMLPRRVRILAQLALACLISPMKLEGFKGPASQLTSCRENVNEIEKK